MTPYVSSTNSSENEDTMNTNKQDIEMIEVDSNEPVQNKSNSESSISPPGIII